MNFCGKRYIKVWIFVVCCAFDLFCQKKAFIILFGSFAKGISTKDSDCDLLVVSDKKEELALHLLPYKVHEMRMTFESYKKAKDEVLIKEIEDNHIIFINHSTYVNIQWRKYEQ